MPVIADMWTIELFFDTLCKKHGPTSHEEKDVRKVAQRATVTTITNKTPGLHPETTWPADPLKCNSSVWHIDKTS